MMHHSSVWCSGAAARVHDVSSERMKVEGVRATAQKRSTATVIPYDRVAKALDARALADCNFMTDVRPRHSAPKVCFERVYSQT